MYLFCLVQVWILEFSIYCQGLQEEKDGKETELLELQKSVNETKSTVSVSVLLIPAKINNEKNQNVWVKVKSCQIGVVLILFDFLVLTIEHSSIWGRYLPP
jgi:hypothetical protein